MLAGQKILGLIPARQNSKGIPHKNIVDLGGQPLISWTITAALESQYLDRVVVSTDGKAIQAAALDAGAEVPFLRPAELATDTSPGIAPVIHACQELPGFDIVVLLQPTSPFRTTTDIDTAIERLLHTQADFCVSVVPPKHHPNWLFTQNSQERLRKLQSDSLVATRQALPELYALNGAVYVARIDALLAEKTLCGENLVAYEMPPERSLDIDTPFDLKVCDLILRDNNA